MGCINSTNTAVQPLTPEKVKRDEDETGSKVSARGDSAVSKGTTDSGVVMENREIPVLPGAVPRKLPSLTSESVRESEVDRITQVGLLQEDSTVQERPKSSEILEELLNQGIIPVVQTRKVGSRVGEAYSIMLDDRDGVKLRPPARLESLKAQKAQTSYSIEEFEEKIRLAGERRKACLRAKSARVRGPAPISCTEQHEDTSLTPVEPLQSPLIHDPTPAPPLHSQVARTAADGGDDEQEMGRADRTDGGEEGGEGGDNRGDGAETGSEDGQQEDEDVTQVEKLKEDQRLTASGELESDSSFLYAEDKEEIF